MKAHTIRSSIACELCRRSKIKCSNKGDDSPCDRCTKMGTECIYKPKGYQQVRRNTLGKYGASRPVNITPGALPSNTPNIATDASVNSNDPRYRLYNHEPYGKKYYYNNFYLTNIKLPPKFLLLRVIHIFFSTQYNGIFQFLHKESYLKHYEESKIDSEYLLQLNLEKNPEFDPILLIAILAICSRFEPSMVEIYGDFNEDENPELYEPKFNLLQSETTGKTKTPYNASNYFGHYARNLVKDVFDKPSVQRIQALAILSSHEWGNTNAARSYLYVGIGARMSALLGLTHADSLCYTNIENNPKLTQMEKNIKLESLRRTMWSIYMMDRANASGRNRSFAVKVEEIKIPIPCYDFEFSTGMKTDYPDYDEALSILGSDIKEKKVSFLGFQIFFYELWSKIAKWCGEVGALKENLSPMDENSNFNKLLHDLNILESRLPDNLKFSSENLNYFIKVNNVENYGYLHCLIFMSKIFLYREIFYLKNSNNLITLTNWWQYTRSLLAIVRDSSNLVKTLKSLNLIVDCPLLAFQIFTNAIICLYFDAFSNQILELLMSKETVSSLKQEYKVMGDINTELLKENIWGMGHKYYSLIKQLNGSNLKNVLEDNFKNKIHDYGTAELAEQIVPPQSGTPDLSIEPETIPSSSSPDNELTTTSVNSITSPSNSNAVTNTILNELIQGFGYENWEIFDMGSVLPGWTAVSPASFLNSPS